MFTSTIIENVPVGQSDLTYIFIYRTMDVAGNHRGIGTVILVRDNFMYKTGFLD